MKRRNLLTLSLGPVLACLLLTGCPAPKPPTDALDDAKARGELIVAMDAGYVPFEVIEADGSFSGFDVDLINEFAKDLKLKVKIKNVTWNGIIGELNTGKADLIISGMSVTDERKKAVSFSDPYFEVGQVVVIRKDEDRIKSFMDLDSAELTIATQEGTTGEKAVRKKFPKAKLLRFPKADQACLAVVQKKADAVVFDRPFLRRYVEKQGKDTLKGLWAPFTEEPIGVAFRKTSPKLVAAFNVTLKRLRDDGTYAKLVAKYFPKRGAVPAPSATPAAKTPAKSE
ncbi:MAG: basic amino acid ABC transporter substrate-binding protein [Planctomycetes bacterium]|nr:basic amino acid ABC transporter substrate-binding protein [Planctomycetota bacterium]